MFLAETEDIGNVFRDFNPLPMILIFLFLFGPAVATYVVLTIRQRREQHRP